MKGIGRKTVGKKIVVTAAAWLLTAVTALALQGCQDSAQSRTGSASNAMQKAAEETRSENDSEPDVKGEEASGTRQKLDPMEEADGVRADVVGGGEGGSDQDEDVVSDHDEKVHLEKSGIENGTQTDDTKELPAGFELVLNSEDWGLSFGEAGTQPRGNALPEDLAWYDAFYVGDDSEKVIYLTFDCGYENGNTELILDALKKHDVKATFFVVGHFLETAPELTKRMVEEGHAVGNHTYHHLDMSAISVMEDFQKEMDDVADLFREITGAELSAYYRPPQGKCNADNLKMAHELGYKTIFWSLAYVDWDQNNQPDRREAVDKLTTRIHPGAIVLLHNTSSTNGKILDELLGRWKEMGYIFKPLSDLTQG